MNIQKYLRLGAFALVGIGLLFSSRILDLVVDYLFFLEVGYTQIFSTQLVVGSILFLIGFVFTTFAIGLSVNVAIRSKIPWVASLPRFLSNGVNQVVMSQGGTRKIGYLIAGVVGLLVGSILSLSWEMFLLFFNQVDFGSIDALFGQDISFYVFSLPVFELLLGLIRFVIFVALFLCGSIYFIRGSFLPKVDLKTFSLDFKTIKIDVRWHIGILFALLFLTTSLGIYLSWFQLLYQPSGVIYGATYTDVVILLPILRVMLVVAGLVGLSGLVFAVSGQTRLLMVTVGVYILA